MLPPGRQKKTFAQKLAGGLEKVLPMAQQFQQEQKQKQQQEAQQQQMGNFLQSLGIEGASNLPADFQMQLLKGYQEQQKPLAKYGAMKEMLGDLGLGGTFGAQGGQGGQQQPGMEPSDGQPQMQEPGVMDLGEVKLKTGPQRIPQERIDAASIAAPNLAKSYIEKNKQIDRDEARREKLQVQERQFFHKESSQYDEGLATEAKAAEKKNRSLDRQLANVDKIGWWDRFISTGIAGPLTDILRSKTAQEFDANTLSQLEGQRQLLGGVLSDSDIRLLMQKIVTASKDPQANRYIAEFMKLENEIPMLKKKIGDELKSENGGYRPANYQSEIDRKFEERYGDEIRDHQQRILSLSDDKDKLNKIGRRSVPPGTPLSDDTILMYLKIANDDPEIATQMAIEDGYNVPQ